MLTLPTPATSAEAYAEVEALTRTIARRRHRLDPVLWATEKLNDTLWSGQADILRAVATHRRTAAVTCHEIGKSYDAAVLTGWWLDTHNPGEAVVVTTAPTGPQVKAILWKEIGRVHSRGELAGRVNQTEWRMSVKDKKSGIVKEEAVALGRKPSDYSPTAFQGIHAPFVLVIVDEANGVRGKLWEAIDSMIANDESKILAIGNPDDPSGEFYEFCTARDTDWYVMHISAFDSPNFTGEPMPPEISRQLIGHRYVEEKRKKWAPQWQWNLARTAVVAPPGVSVDTTHPFWQSKVLGQFPVQSSAGSLIPLTWIHAAQERRLAAVGPNELSLDVGASEDGDPSCCGHRRGPVFRVLYETREPDTMKSTGRLLQTLADQNIGATLAKVDYIGVGRGVVDRAREQQQPVYPITVSEASTHMRCTRCHHTWDTAIISHEKCPQCKSDLFQPEYANMLSQIWWTVRGLFERGEIDIDADDPDLAAELLNVRWEPNSKGQTIVKYLDGPSPNRADALMLAYAPVDTSPKKKRFNRATWGGDKW